MKKEVTAADYVAPVMPVEEPIETIPQIITGDVEKELFMQEMVTILVHESTDSNAVPVVEVSVNGRRIFIPRNINFPVKRMYVERLARAKKTTIQQNLDPRLGDLMNRLNKSTALDYPFTMVEDKNPLGREWLTRVLAEA